MAAGAYPCPCEREERLNAARPEALRTRRPWHWEAARGCGEEPAPEAVVRHDGEPLMRCPARLVEPWCWQVVRLWSAWENGIPPVAGGALDQSAALLDALAVISHAVSEVHERESGATAGPASMPGGFTAATPVRRRR